LREDLFIISKIKEKRKREQRTGQKKQSCGGQGPSFSVMSNPLRVPKRITLPLPTPVPQTNAKKESEERLRQFTFAMLCSFCFLTSNFLASIFAVMSKYQF
jgi:hypothetical protein